MNIPRPPIGPRRAVTAATVAAGVAIGTAFAHLPVIALIAATIATIAALMVLHHLVNQERSQ